MNSPGINREVFKIVLEASQVQETEEVYLVDVDCLCISKYKTTKNKQEVLQYPTTLDEAFDNMAYKISASYYVTENLSLKETQDKVEITKQAILEGLKIKVNE